MLLLATMPMQMVAQVNPQKGYIITNDNKSLFYHILGSEYLNHSRNSFIKPLATTYQFYIWKSKK